MVSRNFFACLSLATILAFNMPAATAVSPVDPDDQKLIDAAGCEELAKEHKNFAAAEKKIAEEIRQRGNSTTAGNVFGVATMAAFGIGFFHWDDTSDAQENLDEMRAYREAIAAAAAKKRCTLVLS